MVGISTVIARLNLLQETTQLVLIQSVLLDHARLFHEVECEQEQTVPRASLCKPKDVKLPVALCILHSNSYHQSDNVS